MIWLALAVAVLLWWLMTGLALMSVHQPPARKRAIFALVSLLALAALFGVEMNAARHTTSATIAGFAMGLVIWAWLELSYLMGYITGPIKRPAAASMRLPQRFYNALGTTIYHEVLVVGVVGIVCILGAGLPNPTIQNTLAVLWLMRWSTKLNLFLGVRHFNSQWLPDNMRYITSYLKAGKNSWFIFFSTIFAAYCTYLLFSFGQIAAEPASALSLFLVGWLAVLAVLEHCFLMMPMGETALWRWAEVNARKSP
ncbi:MAG: putative photosynthetic complex assembly protein PuhE [Luminiphilus sp.]|nr:putative photosynthetic complex assembly protein PuhE [Luminiphilus sp.]MDG2036623.1 putative photosynthetic complex assembly protein PuhE [Luminiphilus sp.]|tara:strand:+ start:400 stop:1161 length:762 start_codon:yes stop_codon:yes gene_type:complete